MPSVPDAVRRSPLLLPNGVLIRNRRSPDSNPPGLSRRTALRCDASANALQQSRTQKRAKGRSQIPQIPQMKRRNGLGGGQKVRGQDGSLPLQTLVRLLLCPYLYHTCSNSSFSGRIPADGSKRRVRQNHGWQNHKARSIWGWMILPRMILPTLSCFPSRRSGGGTK
jgi:hypothetical protein